MTSEEQFIGLKSGDPVSHSDFINLPGMTLSRYMGRLTTKSFQTFAANPKSFARNPDNCSAYVVSFLMVTIIQSEV